MHNENLSRNEHRQVVDFGLAIKDAEASEAWDLLMETLDGLGFGRCLYAYIPDLARLRPDAPIPDVMTFLTTYDDEFMEMFRKYRFHLHCVSVGYAVRHEVPTLLKPIISRNLEQETIPRPFRDWLASYNARTRSYDGILVPLRGPVFSAVGRVSTVVAPEFEPAEATDHAIRHMPVVTELINAFHQTVHFSSLLPRERRLTARERDILLWLSQGLAIRQIAETMGTSPSTVEKQLSSARHRLAAGNNTNLLLKAMAYDLL